jgi:DUF4097 and DUF4098 domain-containing protein YvlB
MKRLFAGAILCLAACAFGAPARAYDQTITKTVPLAANGAFRLENVNGAVEITAWDRNQVEIQAVKTARRSAADLDLVKVDIQSSPALVAVKTLYPKDEGIDVSVEYHVKVPRHALLDSVATVNGIVRVTEMESGGQLRSVNGDVEVYDCAGGYSASSTNGSIHEELRKLGTQPLDLETMNGSVLIAIPASAGAELDAQTMNGEIRTVKPVLMNGDFGQGSFHGKLGPGGAPLRIRTVNGAIQISIWNGTV